MFIYENERFRQATNAAEAWVRYQLIFSLF